MLHIESKSLRTFSCYQKSCSQSKEDEKKKKKKKKKQKSKNIDQFLLFLHFLQHYPKNESLKAVSQIELSTLDTMINLVQTMVSPKQEEEPIYINVRECKFVAAHHLKNEDICYKECKFVANCSQLLFWQTFNIFFKKRNHSDSKRSFSKDLG